MPDKQIKQWESISGAPRAIEHEHAKIHDGLAFTFSHAHSGIANNGSHVLLLSNPASSFVHFRTVRLRFDDAPFDVYLYEDPKPIAVGSRGTLLETHNMNRNSSNVTSLGVYAEPYYDVTSLGLELEQELVPTTGVQGGGTANVNTFEWILKPETDYLLRYKNSSGQTARMSHTAFFYLTGNMD